MTITLPVPDGETVGPILHSLTPSTVVAAALAVLYAAARLHVRYPGFYTSVRSWVGAQLTSQKAAATYLAAEATGWSKYYQWAADRGYHIVGSTTPEFVSTATTLAAVGTACLTVWCVYRLVHHWTTPEAASPATPTTTGREPASQPATDVPAADPELPTAAVTTDVASVKGGSASGELTRDLLRRLNDAYPEVSRSSVLNGGDHSLVLRIRIRDDYGAFRLWTHLRGIDVAVKFVDGDHFFSASPTNKVTLEAAMTPDQVRRFIAITSPHTVTGTTA